VSYFAAAVARDTKGWTAAELDLDGAADIDEIADRLRDVDPEAPVTLLFVESDDAYLVILRLDDGEDLRVFGSDSVFAEESRVGALLLGGIEDPAIEVDDVVVVPEDLEADSTDEDEEIRSPDPDVEPVGDADLLADLGVGAPRLLELCAQEGMLPADITAELCQTIGCGDEVEELREA
jgi:putative tRNA adenosine deaminase-associated protein